MSLLPDPDELRAIAVRIAGHAQAARIRASRLEAAVAATGWQGIAAGAFDLQAADVAAGLRASAGRLDDASDALVRHADNVQHVIDVLRQLGGDLTDLGSDLGAGIIDGAVHPTRLIGDAASLLGDAGHVVGDLGSLIGIG